MRFFSLLLVKLFSVVHAQSAREQFKQYASRVPAFEMNNVDITGPNLASEVVMDNGNGSALHFKVNANNELIPYKNNIGFVLVRYDHGFLVSVSLFNTEGLPTSLSETENISMIKFRLLQTDSVKAELEMIATMDAETAALRPASPFIMMNMYDVKGSLIREESVTAYRYSCCYNLTCFP